MTIRLHGKNQPRSRRFSIGLILATSLAFGGGLACLQHAYADESDSAPLWAEQAVKAEHELEAQNLDSATRSLERATKTWHASPGGLKVNDSDSPDWVNGEFDYKKQHAQQFAPQYVRSNLAALAVDIGDAYQKKGDFDNALKLYNLSIYLAGEDKDSAGYQKLVDCYVSMKEYTEAEQLAEERIRARERTLERIKENQELGVLNLEAGKPLAEDLANQDRKLAEIYKKDNKPEEEKIWLDQANIATAMTFDDSKRFGKHSNENEQPESQLHAITKWIMAGLAACTAIAGVMLLFGKGKRA